LRPEQEFLCFLKILLGMFGHRLERFHNRFFCIIVELRLS
jgi:hypothetical protein